MDAPGSPGIAPTWTSSAKDMIGTALGSSRLWFTVGFGIINEIYYPRVDIPQLRDLGFIVADGKGFWCEVKRHADYTASTPAPGIPAVQIVHHHPRFELALRITPHAERDVLLIEVSLAGDEDLRPYVLLAPHLGGTGHDNRAEVFTNRGRMVLCGEQGPFALALAAVDMEQRDAWLRGAAGYVGTSDGWQDFSKNGAMTWTHERAGPGNVALMGELPRQSVLALGFASGKESAATLAISALIEPFERVWHRQVHTWEDWHERSVDVRHIAPEFRDQMHVSAMVLKAHQDKTYPGAMVASLSIPWGNSSDDIGGYHLVWPRDLAQSAGALLELGALDEARDVLRYLIATQVDDGRWAQNQWLGGTPRWGGIQLDELAFPVLLASALSERDALDGIRISDMVSRALRYIVLQGPATDQERWEENAGINLYTMAATIAALVCGAELIEDPQGGDALLVADDWNAHIEEWCAAGATGIAARLGVDRYYVRSAPARVIADRGSLADIVAIKNRLQDPGIAAAEQVSTDFLQLVRYGLRRADDRVVRDTITVIDALLKAVTPLGTAWYRYNGDGYGEQENGKPYNGTGQGRPWPLLAGERGHYALAAGEDAAPYLRSMAAMSGRLGLIPEQVWDRPAVPRYMLEPGRPTGSAMPLVWAHAEFVKLAASIHRGHAVDRPDAVWLRYVGEKPRPKRAHWTRRAPVSTIVHGQSLRLLLDTAALVHSGIDDWTDMHDIVTRPGMLGLRIADLQTDHLTPGQVVRFTLQDQASGLWDEQQHTITIVDAPQDSAAPSVAR